MKSKFCAVLMLLAVVGTGTFVSGILSSDGFTPVQDNEVALVTGGGICADTGFSIVYGCEDFTKDFTQRCGAIAYLCCIGEYCQNVGIDCYECGEACGDCGGILSPCDYF